MNRAGSNGSKELRYLIIVVEIFSQRVNLMAEPTRIAKRDELQNLRQLHFGLDQIRQGYLLLHLVLGYPKLLKLAHL